MLTPWLPTAGSHSNTTTKTFPAQKATSESFPCPLRSLFPAKTRFTANSRKSALQKCILPRPPSPPPGLGSVPKVGAPLRGFLPYPRVRRPGTRRSQLTMVTPAAVAPPPGPAAWALELERGLLGELQKLVPFAKKTSSRHPSTHRSQWKPRWDSIQAGSETLGEARLS